MKIWLLALVIGVLVVAGGVYFITQQSEDSSQKPSSTSTPDSSRDSSQGDSPQDSTVPESTTPQPKTVEVNIQDFAFSPATVNINEGDIVIWKNQDSVRHTVTSDSGSELDSELLTDGQTYSHTFNDKGSFNYHCTPHPSMKAVVIVG